MDLLVALDAAVARFDLNEHPFYQAWSAGTLPVAKLQAYAQEYAQLIAAIPQGWAQAAEPAYAAEEQRHFQSWERFAQSLGVTAPADQGGYLGDTARHLFARYPDCLGALYAFEVQQPRTAAAKLQGLQTHYQDLVPPPGQEYFRLHLDNTGELALLKDKIQALSTPAPTLSACSLMANLLWHALDGYWYTI